jgi:TonB-linked SusC/RagA family outer membrane protein
MRQKLTQTAAMIMVLLYCLFPGSSVFAQEKTIIGKITSPDGAGIRGVTIQEKGTTNAAISDAAGTYALRISNSNATLIFSYVGYATQEVPVGKDPNLSVQLVPSGRQLSEVVVTALGIKKEIRRVGYAIQEVKGEDLTKAREPDVFNSLEGKVAGLTIAASPELFGRPQIVNRGTKDMLIVVDGVPINSDTWNINADDIDNVSVLKGPNAAALYGFRGQNGAMVITTKKGSRDAKGWQVNFNSSNLIETGNTVLPKDQNEYGRGTGEYYSFGEGLDDHTQRLPTWGPFIGGQPVLQYNSPYNVTTGVRTPTAYKAIGDNNYKNFLSTGAVSSTNISLASSGRNNDIRMSYSHVYQKGTDPNTKINMDNLNINADYDINERLRISSNINLNVQYTPNIPDANYGPNSYVYMFNVYGNTAYDVRDLKNYYQSPMGIPGLRQYSENYGRSNNPYFMANQWLRGHYKTDIYGYIKADYSITHDLVATLRTQFTGWGMERTEDVPAGTILNQYLPWYYWGWYGDYREDRRNLLENNSDFLLSYNKKVSDFNISASVGTSERSFRYSTSYGTTVDLAVPGVYSLSNSQTPSLAYNWRSNMQVYSGYYSLDFGYKNYFNISNTGRVDNVSTLPTGQNTFFYPSVAISTNLADYLNLPSAISYLKLRASYADVKGALTQAQAPSAYALSTGSSVGNLLGYGTEYYTSYDGPSYQNQSAYQVTTYYNNQPAVSYSSTLSDPKLKPYDVKSTEAGLDFRLFQNRLGLDATYFRTVNGPQIYQLSIPSSTAYSSQIVNGVTTLKTGWELTLNASPVKNPRGFSWDVLINWSTYKETLKSIYAGTPLLQTSHHNYSIGERLDDWYSSAYLRDPNGNIIYEGGGPQLASGNSTQAEKYLGHLDPDWSFGINNRFSYKNISLSFQFDGRVGGIIYDDVWYHAMNGGTAIESDQGAIAVGRKADYEAAAAQPNGQLPTTYAGSFIAHGVSIASGTPTFNGGQITNQKSLTFTPNATPIIVQSYLSSALGSNVDEAYTVSRTFVKLREVNLSYAFSPKLLGKSIFKSASVSLVGRNLLYFAKRKDFDIDQYGSGYDAYTGSYAGTSNDVTLSSPTFRRYGLNLNLGF